MLTPQILIQGLVDCNFSIIAKAITFTENSDEAHKNLLQTLKPNPNTKILGITGPPGAGKSTLTNALLDELTKQNKKIAVVSIDPSSPFNFGALLGDRIRMSDYYLNPNVFIRSLASRGSLGGLHPRIIEIIDLLKASIFDYIIIETVGVGQSEVEIAGIADITTVVLVPEAGDEVQTMKAGIMEIADIFVVNKADRPLADEFVKNLRILCHEKSSDIETPVVKTIATRNEGIKELLSAIEIQHTYNSSNTKRRAYLLTEKAYLLIQQHQMRSVQKSELLKSIQKELHNSTFNLYSFVEHFIHTI